MNIVKHIAFIMDGNGRWAKQRNKPRTFGHKHGLVAMKEIVNACLELNIPCISFYAFSTENWNRPLKEVEYLLKIFKNEIVSDKLKKWLMDNSVRFIWNGFKDKINYEVLESINNLEELTKNNSKMTLQIMFNYGSRQKIIESFEYLAKNKINPTIENFNKQINPHNLPELDLLIRTSGEERISNFMLWELCYSEIIFNKKLWPDYSKQDLLLDLENYKNRKRRFGKV